MQRAREEIVRDASVSFRAFSSRGVPSDKDNSIHVERRKPMFKENCSSVPAALILTCFLGVSAAQAQGTGCYTLESLQGSFGVIGTYGSNIAVALGTRTNDAAGNLTGTFVLNSPTVGSTTGARTVTSGTNKGTFTVNCDGTGVVTRIATLADGTTAPAFDDFVITGAVVQNGKLVATNIEDVQRVPSGLIPGGLFLTRKYTRRPDSQTAGCYTLESLQGSYGVVVNYDVNLAMGLQPEYLDGLGNLGRTGINNQPLTGSTTGERTIGNVTSLGTYVVNCNGSGTITRVVTRPDGSKATTADDFLILEGVEQGGKIIATTIFDAQQGPAVVGAGTAFVTRVHTLRPNHNAALEDQLQLLVCGTTAPTPSCTTSVSVWNYYLVNKIDPKAPAFYLGNGTQSMGVQQYLLARAAAGF